MTYYIIGAVVALWMIGGISRHIRGRGKIVSLMEENCTGCGKCLKRCNHKVLEMVTNEKGQHIVVKNPDKCTACSDCVSVCKFKALKIIEKLKSHKA
jgi:ferredoxin